MSGARTAARDAPGLRAGDIPPDELARRAELRSQLTEAQLTHIWRGRRFPDGALVTAAGVPVRVIFQGRPGRGPGPDFRGAVIAGPSGLPVRGDVELHVHEASFRAHGHDRDAAYANVVLHVVFDSGGASETPLPGGGAAPVVALASWVARRAGEIEQWLARPLLWREPCADSVMRLGAEGVQAALEAEGDRRFAAKVARFAEAVRIGGAEQAMYEGLLEAMGYGGNAPPMLMLARLLPWSVVAGHIEQTGDRAAALESALIGGAGLLPSQRSHRGPVEPHAQALERAFAASNLPALRDAPWKLWGIRPENHPARRLAGAAALLADPRGPRTLLDSLVASTVNEAVAPLVRVAPAGFWRHHHDLCAAPSRLPSAFIGKSRALEILVNVVLPAAAAAGNETEARALYARLPRPSAYGVTRFLEQSLASDGVRIPLNARRAQGLLALHRDWCTQNGCGRCPLS